MPNIIKIYIITLMSFFVGTSQFIIAGVLDKVAASANINLSSAGQLITSFALMGVIITPALTLFVSKYSLKIQMSIAVLIFLIGTILTTISLKFEILILARAVTGIGSIFFVVVAYVLAASLAKVGKEGSAIADVALGFSLSLVFGIQIGRYIANLYGWQMIFYIIFSVVLIGWIVLILIIEGKKPKEIPGIKEQISIIKNKKILISFIITVFVFTGFSALNTYITPILFSIENLSEHNISITFLILGIGSMIGSKSGATLADKVGVLKILLSALCVVILSSIAMAFLSFSMNYFLIALTIWTTAMWMFGPTQSFNLSRLSPQNASIILSLNSSLLQVGFGLGAFFGGAILEHFDPKTILIFCAVIAVVSFVLQILSKRIN